MAERFGGLHLVWAAFGWLIAASLTALVLLGLTALGVADDPGGQGSWVAVALLAGFGAGGFLVGYRHGLAPTLHGLVIGLFSVLVWVVVNLALGEPTGLEAWKVMSARSAATLLFIQTAAAVVGARVGVRLRPPGAPSAEDEF